VFPVASRQGRDRVVLALRTMRRQRTLSAGISISSILAVASAVSPAHPWRALTGGNREDQHCQALFDAGLYEPAGVRAMIARLARLLDAVSRHPDGSLAELLTMSIEHTS